FPQICRPFSTTQPKSRQPFSPKTARRQATPDSYAQSGLIGLAHVGQVVGEFLRTTSTATQEALDSGPKTKFPVWDGRECRRFRLSCSNGMKSFRTPSCFPCTRVSKPSLNTFRRRPISDKRVACRVRKLSRCSVVGLWPQSTRMPESIHSQAVERCE